MDQAALARKHLERRLAPLRERAELTRPSKGWARAIRDSLGMTTRQLAARLGKVQSAVVDIEKGEVAETATLASLRQVAQALDCTLVYALVPNRPLDDTMRLRAAKVADRQLAPVGHTMALENQGLDEESLAAERQRLIEDLLRGKPSRLWDEA